MSPKQADYLRILCERHGREFDPTLTRSQASDLIELLKPRLPAQEAARERRCPHCGAAARSFCLTGSGRLRASCHVQRYAA